MYWWRNELISLLILYNEKDHGNPQTSISINKIIDIL